MPYLTDYDRIVLEEGREEGLIEGRQKLRAVILKTVERHFGAPAPELAPMIDAITDLDVLQKVFEMSWDSANLADFMDKVSDIRS